MKTQKQVFGVTFTIILGLVLIIGLIIPGVMGQTLSEGIPLPKRTSGATTPTLTMQKTPAGTPAASLDQTPQLLMELHAFKVEVEPKYEFGVTWNRNKLEKILGKPLRGYFMPSLLDDNQLEVQTLVLPDVKNMLEYLSEFGKVKILYSQTWTQPLGEQITREYKSVLPYITKFDAAPSEQGKSTPYSQTSVQVGMTVNITLNGLQISGEEPSADVIIEVDLKDAYKTDDNLYAVNSIISGDSATIPIKHTLIQTNLFYHEKVRNEYIFLLTPRKMK